jgi:hypothetical protein
LETSCSVLRDEAYKARRSNAALQAEATDSKFGPDDVIIGCRGDQVIGLNILHTSRHARAHGN